MKIILRSRRQGKTTELIKHAAKDFNYIVCHSKNEVERVAEMAKQMKLDIPYPVTYAEVINKHYYGKGVKGFAIDNAELFIQSIIRDVEVTAMSINLDISKQEDI